MMFARISSVIALALVHSAGVMAQDVVEEDPSLSSPSELDLLSSSPQSELDELSSSQDSFLEFDMPEEREAVSVTIRALDKITAKFVDLTIPMDETATFGSLTVLARYCDTRPPEEFPETTAFLQIFDERTALLDIKDDVPELIAEQVPQNAEPVTASLSEDVDHNAIALPSVEVNEFNIEGEKIFSGWMFASSPALNPLEHPVYDVWVIGCETRTVTQAE